MTILGWVARSRNTRPKAADVFLLTATRGDSGRYAAIVPAILTPRSSALADIP